MTSRLPLNRKLRVDTTIPCAVRWPAVRVSGVRYYPAVRCPVSSVRWPLSGILMSGILVSAPCDAGMMGRCGLTLARCHTDCSSLCQLILMGNGNMVRAGNIIFFTLLINFLPLFSFLVILNIFLVHPVEISHYVVLVSGSKWHNGVLVTCVCLLQTRRCEYDNGSRDSPHLPPHHASIWATSPHTPQPQLLNCHSLSLSSPSDVCLVSTWRLVVIGSLNIN